MLGVVVFTIGLSAVFGEASYGESRCFDCNYAPSGYVSKRPNYWDVVSPNAGYLACALTSYADAASLDKWSCRSGQCFIRKDPNGLVYRGCANKENLPLGVDPYKQCAYQGDSLWYFCKGDLCNNKQLGDYGVCGRKPSPKQVAYNPCDGKCDYNPSGLFADSYNKNGFIQCGCDYRTDPYTGKSEACICCKPFYLNCPYGTAFDDYTKVCSKAAHANVQPKYVEPVYPVPAPTYKEPRKEVYVAPVYKEPGYGQPRRQPVYKPKKPVKVVPVYKVPVHGVPYKQPVYPPPAKQVYP